ncbi:hypothetical protein VNI00_009184 [Paramarasmius palmivorus]|uniref:Uncharacterized protein n=1 Tax=Paramarasmius palmivorus TaxID=297713 RepID=A0AAW0CNU5_9AGAR
MNVPLSKLLVIIPLMNHIAIFLAISFKLMPPSWDDREELGARVEHVKTPITLSLKLRKRVKAFWSGKDLPMLSKTLLQDGQMYILVFIMTSLVSVIPMSRNDIPVVYRFIFIAPHVAIENSMNSYLFRSVRAATLSTDRLRTGTNLNLR